MKTIMLVDDNEDDNFFHTRVIKKSFSDVNIVSHTSAGRRIGKFEEC